MLKRIVRTKTFWAAVAALITALERLLTGNASLEQALQILVPAILALFLRDGIAKMENGADGM